MSDDKFCVLYIYMFYPNQKDVSHLFNELAFLLHMFLQQCRCPTPKFSQNWDLLSPPNYFTSSDPHHDMLGGGCQVRVVIENMMGRMENLRTLISGFLGLVILVRWALVTMFLS